MYVAGTHEIARSHGSVSSTSSAAGKTSTALRTDIQALRAVAVAVVVIYHAWPNALPGGFVGVDVFFVVSGFLITTHLIARPPGSAGDLGRFWARRILRLLPALTVVVLAVLAATRLLAPAARWHATGWDSIASALYVQNWRLVAGATDYLGGDPSSSPLQHFWSLSVEEQYYLVWPLLIAAAAVLARRRGLAPAAVYAAAVGTLTIVSFAFGYLLTSGNGEVAYLATHTRVWQLGVGSLLAAIVAIPRDFRLTVAARTTLLLGGYAALVVAVIAIDRGTPYPGTAALLPTLGTAAIIAARDPRTRLNPRRVTTWQPVQWLGGVSYSLYLWHWPLLVLPVAALGRPLDLLETCAAVVAGLLLAHASTYLLELPIRRARTLGVGSRRAFALGALCTVLVIIGGTLLILAGDQRVDADREQVAEELDSADDCLGAGSLDPELNCPHERELVTTPAFAAQDVTVAISAECLNWVPYDEVVSCSGGSTDPGAPRVALYGNSHAGQWFPALDALGKEHGWSITTYIVGICQPTAAVSAYAEGIGTWSAQTLSEECAAFESELITQIAGEHYDAVVLSAGDSMSLTEPDDYLPTFEALTGSGARLLVVRDTPAPLKTIPVPPDCVSAHGAYAPECSGDPDVWIQADPMSQAAAELDQTNVATVDLNSFICAAQTCSSVVGGVIVYSDNNHLSQTYVQTLIPRVEPHLLTLLQPGG